MVVQFVRNRQETEPDRLLAVPMNFQRLENVMLQSSEHRNRANKKEQT
jgi:hypothetical protein